MKRIILSAVAIATLGISANAVNTDNLSKETENLVEQKSQILSKKQTIADDVKTANGEYIKYSYTIKSFIEDEKQNNAIDSIAKKYIADMNNQLTIADEVAKNAEKHFIKNGYLNIKAKAVKSDDGINLELTIKKVVLNIENKSNISDDYIKNAFVDAEGQSLTTSILTEKQTLLNSLYGTKIETFSVTNEEESQKINLKIDKGSRYSGSVSINNDGNEALGEWRKILNLNVNNILSTPSQVSLTHLDSQHLKFSNLSYSHLFANNIKAQMNFSQMDYSLGDVFSELGAGGESTTKSLKISKNFGNFSIFGERTLRDTKDHISLNDSLTSKTNRATKVGIDYVVGNNYFMFSNKRGTIDKDVRIGSSAENEKTDFNIWNASVVNKYAINKNTFLTSTLNTQYSNKEVDGSEKFDATPKAYEQGSQVGDKGIFLKSELIYKTTSIFTNSIFAEYGETRAAETPLYKEERSLRDIGTSLSFKFKDFSGGISYQIGENDKEENHESTKFNLSYRF